MIEEDAATGAGRADVPDEALVRAALRDESAFARPARRYLRKAMAVALEYAANREDAEDLVQDTFRGVWSNLDRYDSSQRFEPWFFTILRNTGRGAAKRGRVRRRYARATGEAT